ncbi:hypothetical protein BY458DRAFT_550170 [Sporodiniella umbellata]|nr:hypothetical protein BY458DRAFT_550170 [Sporodiniella umbellata]
MYMYMHTASLLKRNFPNKKLPLSLQHRYAANSGENTHKRTLSEMRNDFLMRKAFVPAHSFILFLSRQPCQKIFFVYGPLYMLFLTVDWICIKPDNKKYKWQSSQLGIKENNNVFKTRAVIKPSKCSIIVIGP